MADRPLKPHYRGMEAGAAEMARYRARLADSLGAPRRSRLWLPLGAAAAMAACAVALSLLIASHRGFPQQELGAIQVLAAADSPEVRQRARELAVRGEALDRWNALMLLSLTEPVERGVRFAAQGLQEDPRAEFRSFYLEYLLEHADEYRYNAPLLEDLMDREPDEFCFELYRQLLSLVT